MTIPFNAPAGCEGKIQYASPEIAEINRKRFSRNKKAQHERLNIYRCPECKKWHIGTLR